MHPSGRYRYHGQPVVRRETLRIPLDLCAIDTEHRQIAQIPRRALDIDADRLGDP
jgi:hypothetical protein